jgi:predicted DNA-binding protein
MTTVTISDKLRQKLKQLAAKYDTTQADIIKKALELFEKYEPQIDFNRSKKHNLEKNGSSESSDNARNAKVKKVLAEAVANFETNYPEIAQRRKKLQQNLHLLDEATITNWSLPFEE